MKMLEIKDVQSARECRQWPVRVRLRRHFSFQHLAGPLDSGGPPFLVPMTLYQVPRIFDEAWICFTRKQAVHMQQYSCRG